MVEQRRWIPLQEPFLVTRRPAPATPGHQRSSHAVLAALLALLALLLAACANTAPAQPTPATSQSDETRGAATGGVEASFPTQTSEGGQVSVAITWSGPESGLVFDVAMNTHSVDLDGYDLAQLAVLRTDTAQEVRPSGWDAAGGGHHRAGTLTFPSQDADGKPLLGPNVRAITLIIRNVAGIPERSFQWTW